MRRLLALAAALFAVHAPPAGRDGIVVGAVPLGDGARVLFRLPDGFAPDPARPGSWVRTWADGPAQCRLMAGVRAVASRRGVRFDPLTGRLTYRLDGRRELRVAARDSDGERQTWRASADGLGIGRPPVDAVVRFPAPRLPGAPAVLLRLRLEAALDTTSIVQRTAGALGDCGHRARREGPAVVDAVTATAEVTIARRGAP